MATHSSVLAWRIPGTGEPGGLPSMVSHRVGHDLAAAAAAAAAWYKGKKYTVWILKCFHLNYGSSLLAMWLVNFSKFQVPCFFLKNEITSISYSCYQD